MPSGQFVLPVAFLTFFPLCRLLHVHFLEIFSPQESLRYDKIGPSSTEKDQVATL